LSFIYQHLTVKSLRSGKVLFFFIAVALRPIIDIIFSLKTFGSTTRQIVDDWEEINSRWESSFGRKATMSGKISAEQVHTRLSQALNELQGLRNNSSIPEALFDVWENKFNRWLSELSNINKEV